jgi:hypothetical protein
MPRPYEPCRRSGVSLIFVSVLLTVAAVIFVAFLPGRDAGDRNRKNLDTVKKLEKVEEAMRGFMAFNGRRPCPADGSSALGTASFGKETDTQGDGLCTGAPMGPDAGSGHIVAGTIPTRSLYLPDDYAFDAWGRRFTYLVDTRATSNSSCLALEGVTQNQPVPTGSGGLQVQIKDPAGNLALTDNVMYAYLSHGPDGFGAFPAQGSSVAGRINTGSADADQMTNAGVDASFTYNPANFTNTRVLKDATATFDDILWYRNDLKNICCLGPKCKLGSGGGGPCGNPGNQPHQGPDGFIINGVHTGDDSGWSLAMADVNGDGITDLIIGAPWAPSTTQYGAVYVIFGTKNGFPDPLPLNSLNGTNGVEFDGMAASDAVGSSVAVADVNGDGIPDIIIGAEGASPNGNTRAGSVYVVFGSTTGWPHTPITLNSAFLNGSNGVEFDGVVNQTYIGMALAAGDINGDGVADIIMGSYVAGPNGNQQAGSVYVVFGKKSGWPGTPTSLNNYCLNGTNGVEFDGAASGDAAGFSVAAGDINGDGIADLLIGAPDVVLNGNQQVGSVYAVFGNKCGGTWPTPCAAVQALNSSFLNGTNGIEFDGVGWGDQVGLSVAAGDVNGDGITDLLIGRTGGSSMDPNAAHVGPVAVVFGKKNGWSGAPKVLNGIILNGSSGFSIDASPSFAFCSAQPALTVGDVNGDGITDIVIGRALEYIYTGTPSGWLGAAYVVFGQCSWPAYFDIGGGYITSGVKGSDFRVTSPSEACTEVATGDINDDGIVDLIVGQPWAGAGYNTPNNTFVYFGRQSGWPTSPYDLNGL